MIPAPLVLIAIGLAIPLLGISLLAFLALDGVIGLVRSRAKPSAEEVTAS